MVDCKINPTLFGQKSQTDKYSQKDTQNILNPEFSFVYLIFLSVLTIQIIQYLVNIMQIISIAEFD